MYPRPLALLATHQRSLPRISSPRSTLRSARSSSRFSAAHTRLSCSPRAAASPARIRKKLCFTARPYSSCLVYDFQLGEAVRPSNSPVARSRIPFLLHLPRLRAQLRLRHQLAHVSPRLSSPLSFSPTSLRLFAARPCRPCARDPFLFFYFPGKRRMLERAVDIN